MLFTSIKGSFLTLYGILMKYVKIERGVKLASFISPMSATLSDEPPFDDPKWLFEIKWDGYRAVAE